jgi:uncharacterized membrane protein
MENKIRIGEGLNTSFKIMNASVGPFLLMGLILIGIIIVTTLFSMIPFLGVLIGLVLGFVIFPALYCGIILAALKAHDGTGEVEVGDMFKGFDFLGPAVLVTIVVAIFTIIASIPGAIFFVPGILMITSDGPVAAGVMLIIIGGFVWLLAILIIATLYVFAYVAVVDKKHSFWEAMEFSRTLVFKNFWGSLGTLILAEIIEFVGVLVCGIGLIYAYPLQYCFVVSVYRTAVPADVEPKHVRGASAGSPK